MLKKLGKKLKKGLKKAAPLIALAGAAALAAKKGKSAKALTPKYMGGNKTGDANIAENIAKFDRDITKMGAMNSDGRSGTQGGDEQSNYYKKGGRVKGAGVAKRGFGRAFKGGRK